MGESVVDHDDPSENAKPSRSAPRISQISLRISRLFNLLRPIGKVRAHTSTVDRGPEHFASALRVALEESRSSPLNQPDYSTPDSVRAFICDHDHSTEQCLGLK